MYCHDTCSIESSSYCCPRRSSCGSTCKKDLSCCRKNENTDTKCKGMKYQNVFDDSNISPEESKAIAQNSIKSYSQNCACSSKNSTNSTSQPDKPPTPLSPTCHMEPLPPSSSSSTQYYDYYNTGSKRKNKTVQNTPKKEESPRSKESNCADEKCTGEDGTGPFSLQSASDLLKKLSQALCENNKLKGELSDTKEEFGKEREGYVYRISELETDIENLNSERQIYRELYRESLREVEKMSLNAVTELKGTLLENSMLKVENAELKGEQKLFITRCECQEEQIKKLECDESKYVKSIIDSLEQHKRDVKKQQRRLSQIETLYLRELSKFKKKHSGASLLPPPPLKHVPPPKNSSEHIIPPPTILKREPKSSSLYASKIDDEEFYRKVTERAKAIIHSQREREMKKEEKIKTKMRRKVSESSLGGERTIYRAESRQRRVFTKRGLDENNNRVEIGRKESIISDDGPNIRYKIRERSREHKHREGNNEVFKMREKSKSLYGGSGRRERERESFEKDSIEEDKLLRELFFKNLNK